jgi:ketosteroid isomerase-like protein
MRFAACAIAAALLAPVVFSATPHSADGEKVWSLETAYWDYVKANELEKYRTLWHPDFLGWPSVSPAPLGKDHVTDWIAAHSSKGERLQSFELERLAVQVTGGLATTTYRVRLTWATNKGAGQPSTIRIIHTWLRGAGDNWQIISGMSAPTDAEGH